MLPNDPQIIQPINCRDTRSPVWLVAVRAPQAAILPPRRREA
jgi:hypothetical protein